MNNCKISTVATRNHRRWLDSDIQNSYNVFEYPKNIKEPILKNGTLLENQTENNETDNESADDLMESFDYTFVSTVARIAFYDDLKSAPRVTEIQPAPTGDFIEALASSVYEQAKTAGGTIPYTVIREVSENFIHARFTEIIISILDQGNTIRFADQGPGINHKEHAQLPGFSSAIEPMKHYIRGVGSGLPIVKEYLDFSHGSISIEDNLGSGAVVTISLTGSAKDIALEPLDKEALRPSSIEPAHSSSVSTSSENAGFKVEQREFQSEPVQRLYQTPHIESPLQPIYSVAPEMAAPAVYPTSYQQGSFPESPYYPQSSGAPYQQPPYAAAPTYQPGYQGGFQQGFQQPQGYAPQPMAPYQQGYAAPYQQPAAHRAVPLQPLSQRERDFLPIFLNEGALGVTDLVRLTGVPQSSTYVTLSKLEEAGLIDKTVGQKRILTDLGYEVARAL